NEPLDRLYEELISERRLVPADSKAQARVVVDVQEAVQDREGVNVVGDRHEVAERFRKSAAEHEPLAGGCECVVDLCLPALQVAAVVELGEVVELKNIFIIP